MNAGLTPSVRSTNGARSGLDESLRVTGDPEAVPLDPVEDAIGEHDVVPADAVELEELDAEPGEGPALLGPPDRDHPAAVHVVRHHQFVDGGKERCGDRPVGSDHLEVQLAGRHAALLTRAHEHGEPIGAVDDQCERPLQAGAGLARTARELGVLDRADLGHGRPPVVGQQVG